MKSIHQIISDAEHSYKPGEERVIIPVKTRVSNPSTVRPSALDSCPLKHAYSKMGVDGVYEVEEGNRSLQHLFKMGEYAAYLIQESLMMYAMKNNGISFEPEVDIASDHYRMSGRADGVMTLREGNRDRTLIIEIKNTEGQQQRSVGKCRLSYALQTIAYMLMSDVDEGLIVCTSKWKVTTYEVKTVNTSILGKLSKKFLVYDSNGELLDEEWNTTSTLNEDEIHTRVQLRLDYMEQVAAQEADNQWSDEDPVYLERPIENPFDHKQGYQCFWMFDKGRHKRPPLRRAKCTMNCKFAERCYGISHTETVYVKKDLDGNWLMPGQLSQTEYEDENEDQQ